MRRRASIIGALLTWVAVAAGAQDCSTEKNGSGTFLDCYARIFTEVAGSALAEKAPMSAEKAEKAAEAADAQRAELQLSGNSSEQAGAAESIKDFLPGLVTGLGLGAISEDEGSQTLKYNFANSGPWVPSLKVVRRDAEPLEGLIGALPEEIRAARKETLSKGIGDFDDVTYSVAFAFEGELGGTLYGRSFATYDKITSGVFDGLFDAIRDNRALSTGRAALVARENEIRGGIRADAAAAGIDVKVVCTGETVAPEDADRARIMICFGDPVATAYGSPETEAAAAAYEESLIAFAIEDAERAQGLQQGLQRVGYFGLADLIRNQPQLHFEIYSRERSGSVGPDEWGASASWEYGFGSLNRALAHCDRNLLARDEGSGKSCLREFLDEERRQIGNGSRVALSLDYSKTSDFNFSLADDAFEFSLDEAEEWKGSATFGWSLTVDEEGSDVSRFDLEAAYEDVTGDPMRQSRFTAAATLTQRVSDTLFASIGAVYANRPEYRGEVDEEISARAGIKWKLAKKEKKDS